MIVFDVKADDPVVWSSFHQDLKSGMGSHACVWHPLSKTPIRILSWRHQEDVLLLEFLYLVFTHNKLRVNQRIKDLI